MAALWLDKNLRGQPWSSPALTSQLMGDNGAQWLADLERSFKVLEVSVRVRSLLAFLSIPRQRLCGEELERPLLKFLGEVYLTLCVFDFVFFLNIHIYWMLITLD